jgi:hypothetical protein
MKAECSIRVAYANPTMAIQFGNSIEPRATNEHGARKGETSPQPVFCTKAVVTDSLVTSPKTTTKTISPEQIIIPVLNLKGCAFPL